MPCNLTALQVGNLQDSTHKTNDLGMPFFAAVVVDGNGETQMAFIFLISDENDENEDNIRDMIKVFKDKNPAWSKIQVVITDKDMKVLYCEHLREKSQ